MQAYFGVNAVKRLGRLVRRNEDSQPYFNRLDEFLIMILDNNVYQIASNVTDPNEFDSFLRSYKSGAWLRFSLYIISQSIADQCPDEGRVPSEGG